MRAGIGVGMPFSNPKPKYFFSDNFNRADGNTLGPSYTIYAGTWGIEGNAAKVVTVAGARETALVNTPVSNVQIEVTFLSANLARLMFRATDHLNGFFFGQSSNAYGIYKLVAGTVTTINTLTTALTVGDRVKVVAKGSSIKCYLNDNMIFDITDTQYMNNKGHGLHTQNAPSKFDDFKIIEI
jgi:hypothetical protein